MADEHAYLRKKPKLSQGAQCYAINCYNYRNLNFKERGITFHSFPNQNHEPDRYHQWVRACQRGDRKPSKWARLCSDHFTHDSFDRTGQTVRLREGAIPTIFKVLVDPQTSTTQRHNAKCKTAETDAAADEDTGEIHAFRLYDDHAYFLESPIEAAKQVNKLRQRIEDLQRELEKLAKCCQQTKRKEHGGD